MDYTIIVPIASSIVGGIIVALANHLLTKHRDVIKQKSDLRISYLIESWKNIERASKTTDRSRDQILDLYDGLEDALASITLLGTRNEVQLAERLAQEMAKGPGADSTGLINGLRKSLRKELGLEQVNDMTLFVRMARKV